MGIQDSAIQVKVKLACKLRCCLFYENKEIWLDTSNLDRWMTAYGDHESHVIRAGPTSRRFGYRRLNPGYQHVCCNQLFSRSEFKAHKAEHHRKGFICPTCNKSFEFRLGLLRHKQIHERKYKCGMCGFSTQNKIKLKRHKKAKHPQIHKCVNCPYQTTSDYKIKRHHQKHRKQQDKTWTDWKMEQILKKVLEEKGIRVPDE